MAITAGDAFFDLYSDKVGKINIDNTRSTVLYSESLYGLGVGEMTLESTEVDKWDSILTGEQGENLKFRWYGYVNDKQVYSDWKNIQVTKCKATYSINRVKIVADIVCNGFNLKRNCSNRLYGSNLISDMVKEIAVLNNLKYDIEPTKNKYNKAQGTLNDYDFILELTEEATSSTGTGDYRFYVKNGNTIVFKPFKNIVSDRLGVLSNVPIPDCDVRINDFELQYRRFDMDGAGEKIETRGINKLTSEPLFLIIDGTKNYLPNLTSKQPPVTKKTRRIDILTNTPTFGMKNPGDANDQSISLWSHKANGLYRSDFRCDFIPSAKVGMTVNVINSIVSGKKHFTSGSWLIYEVNHELRPKELYTRLCVERRGYN